MIPSGFSPRSGRKSSAKDADAERNRPFLDRTEEEEQKRGFQEVLVVKAEEEEKRDLGEGLREPLRKRVPWEEMLLQAMIDLQTTRGKSQDEETLSGRGRGLDRCTRDHRKSTVQVNRWCVRWPVEIIGSTPTDGIGSPSLTCARATFMWARKEFGFATDDCVVPQSHDSACHAELEKSGISVSNCACECFRHTLSNHTATSPAAAIKKASAISSPPYLAAMAPSLFFRAASRGGYMELLQHCLGAVEP
ncbi:hypothetical protein BHM03_00007177 [Ensete ventricosum]|nr:hypothetical protein BHM03_00007177 [Ensete ventricosum]